MGARICLRDGANAGPPPFLLLLELSLARPERQYASFETRISLAQNVARIRCATKSKCNMNSALSIVRRLPPDSLFVRITACFALECHIVVDSKRKSARHLAMYTATGDKDQNRCGEKNSSTVEVVKVDVNIEVEEKDAGTTMDKAYMALFERKQVLRRHFNFPTMLAFASTAMCAFPIQLPLMPYALSNGGRPIVVWGLIMGWIFAVPVYMSLAEMASMQAS